MHVIEYGLVVGYSVVQLAGVFYPTYVHNMVYLILDIKTKVKILYDLLQLIFGLSGIFKLLYF